MLRRKGIRLDRVLAVTIAFVLTAWGVALVGSAAAPKAAATEAAATGEPVPFGLALATPSDAALRASLGQTAEAKVEPASTFRDVRVEATPEGVLVTLEADGKIGVTKVFTMSGPPRLVVDLPGLGSEIAESQWEIGSPFVERVRMKAHPNKVRVVFDAGEQGDQFVNRRLVPFHGGLMVAIGTGEPLSAALARALDSGASGAPASGAETVPATSATAGRKPASQPEWVEAAVPVAGQSPVQVYGVNFDSQADRDRIVVLTNGLVDYEVHQPDPETVVFSLLDAVISPAAEGRLVVRSGSPISLVTAFQQPDVPVDEVRIVVERTPGLEPVVTPKGPLLFIDFARQEAAADPGLVPAIRPADEARAREASAADASPPPAQQIDSGFGGTGFE
ncbi:MAG: AMIN domain-containing protein, partial [Myxococcota bacterium]